MQNLSFVCLGHNQNTTFAVLVINEHNRIIDSQADLHDLHAANNFTLKKYKHEITTEECFACYGAWREHNKQSPKQ